MILDQRILRRAFLKLPNNANWLCILALTCIQYAISTGLGKTRSRQDVELLTFASYYAWAWIRVAHSKNQLNKCNILLEDVEMIVPKITETRCIIQAVDGMQP